MDDSILPHFAEAPLFLPRQIRDIVVKDEVYAKYCMEVNYKACTSEPAITYAGRGSVALPEEVEHRRSSLLHVTFAHRPPKDIRVVKVYPISAPSRAPQARLRLRSGHEAAR